MSRLPLSWLPLLILVGLAPAQGVLHEIDGQLAGERLGSVVCGLGDLDLDGVPELAATTAAGRVDVLDGATGSLRFSLTGPPGGDFGTALCGLFDVDGDAVPDIAVGAPAASNPALPGSVYIFSGVAGAPIATINGLSAGDRFGAVLLEYDDLNGNGVRELVVGASHADLPLQDAGRVEIIDPSTGARLVALNGAYQSDNFGSAIALLDDVNGDGLREIAVGAPLGNQTGTQPGYFGGTGMVTVFASGGIWNWLVQIPGPNADDLFGAALAGCGDLDGDGNEDLAIASPGFDGVVGTDCGRVDFRSIPGGQLIHLREGQVAGERYGERLASAGDFDGDGKEEVVAGAPFSGANSAGRLELISGQNAQALFSLTGIGPFENLGAAIAPLSDHGFDGVGEFVFASPGASPGGRLFAGALRSISGRAVLQGKAAVGELATLGSSFERPLKIDGSFGGVFDARVEIPVGQPFTMQIDQPSTRLDPADFVVFGILGIPPLTAAVDLPWSLGRTSFAPWPFDPVLQPISFTLLDGFGLGLAPLMPATSTPFYASNPGIGFPIAVTFQGLLEITPGVVKPTNALVLVVD